MKVLLDTNAYSALMRGDRNVAEWVRGAEQVLLSTVVAGELFHGFRGGSRFDENRRLFARFLENPYVGLLPVTLTTADRFGRIAARLQIKGRPIPTNDVWIAAHAMESGADLLSFDPHFESVDGLAWVHLPAVG